jgi:hypothetical protein
MPARRACSVLAISSRTIKRKENPSRERSFFRHGNDNRLFCIPARATGPRACGSVAVRRRLSWCAV